jgi:hypothetical protein
MTFNEVSSNTRFRNRITTKSFSLLLLESQNHGTLINDVVSNNFILFFK